MPQIILKERTANVVIYTFFTRDVDQYQNRSLSQLYQPPRTALTAISQPCHYVLIIFFSRHIV